MVAGTIIILNGTSSAGKTTLARARQHALEDPYLCLSIDTFLSTLPQRYYSPDPSTDPNVSTYLVHTDAAGPRIEMQIGAVEDRACRAMYAAIAALAQHGNNVIFDDVMTEPTWVQEAVIAFHRLRVLFVGVRCPLAVVEQREQERGDRLVGLARGLYDRVPVHGQYDLELDTAQQTVEQCVETVLQALNAPPRVSAFERLYTGLNGS